MHVKSDRVLLVAILGLLITACGGGGGGTPPVIIIDPPVLGPGQVASAEGTVQGATEGDLLVFRGVRYAAAPVGDLRFRAPAAPAAFSGVRDALTFGSNCIQSQGAAAVGSEDCLFLNIWAHGDDVQRPVMVYMHPGAANGIGGDLSSIDPADLAESSDVVVVNINRRLGVMGYLAIDELIAENPRMTAGNYGLLDAIESLKWIQANIDEFNGDPNRVMLLGTSSGGILTCLMLGAPDAAGLIHAAAVQSAPCTGRTIQALQPSSPHNSRNPPAVQTHRGILTQTGCDVAADIPACLRAMSAEDLILASGPVELAVSYALFAPLVDGVVVQDAPRDALVNQTIGDIPLIIGMASNEVGSTLDGFPIPDDAAYRAWLTSAFSSPLDDAVYALYPTANYPSAKDAYVALIADIGYNCSAEIFALRAMSGAPSYLYEISRGFNDGAEPGSSAFHAIDIPYLFGTYDVFGYTPDAQSFAITNAMRNAWTSLITDPTSAPSLSDDGTVLWPIFEPVAATYAEFGDNIGGATNHADGRCAALRDVF